MGSFVSTTKEVSWAVRDSFGALRAIVEPPIWYLVARVWVAVLRAAMLALEVDMGVAEVSLQALALSVKAARDIVARRIWSMERSFVGRAVELTMLSAGLTAVTMTFFLPLYAVFLCTFALAKIGKPLMRLSLDGLDYVVLHKVPKKF